MHELKIFKISQTLRVVCVYVCLGAGKMLKKGHTSRERLTLPCISDIAPLTCDSMHGTLSHY